MKRVLRTAALGLALTAAVACNPTNVLTNKPAAAPAAGAPDATTGGTLRIGVPRAQGIEPLQAYEPGGRLIASSMCDTLYSIDPATGEVKPNLAKSWKWGDDGTTLYITLRRDLKFSNGVELTSADVSESLARLSDPARGSNMRHLLSQVRGYKDKAAEAGVPTGKSEAMGSVQIIDTWSLRITLKNSDPSFLRVLADVATAPVDVDASVSDPEGFSRKPVCAGPYRAKSAWNPGDGTLVLERNPNAPKGNSAATRSGAGYPDTLEFNAKADPAARLADYTAGRTDVVQATPGAVLPPDSQSATGNGTMLDFLGFATGRPPFNNEKVRVALGQAIDRNALAARKPGARAPLTGYVPPTAGKPGRCVAQAPAAGDVKAARETLAASGVNLTGQSVDLYFNDEFGNADVVASIAKNWEQAFGLKVVPKPVPGDTYLAQLAAAGSNGAFLQSWDSTVVRPIDYIQPLLTRDGMGSGLRSGNFTHFDEPRVNDIDRRQKDEGEQARTFGRIEQIGCELAPLSPLTVHTSQFLVRTAAVGTARGAAVGPDGTLQLRELFAKKPAAGAPAAPGALAPAGGK